MKGATFHKCRRHWYFSRSCVFLSMGINRAKREASKNSCPMWISQEEKGYGNFPRSSFRKPSLAITWAIQVILQESTTEHVFFPRMVLNEKRLFMLLSFVHGEKGVDSMVMDPSLKCQKDKGKVNLLCWKKSDFLLGTGFMYPMACPKIFVLLPVRTQIPLTPS